MLNFQLPMTACREPIGQAPPHRGRNSNSIRENRYASADPCKFFLLQSRRRSSWSKMSTQSGRRCVNDENLFSHPMPIHSKQILIAFSNTVFTSPLYMPKHIQSTPAARSTSERSVSFFFIIPLPPPCVLQSELSNLLLNESLKQDHQ